MPQASPKGQGLAHRRQGAAPPVGYLLVKITSVSLPLHRPRTPDPWGRRILKACGPLPPTPKENPRKNLIQKDPRKHRVAAGSRRTSDLRWNQPLRAPGKGSQPMSGRQAGKPGRRTRRLKENQESDVAKAQKIRPERSLGDQETPLETSSDPRNARREPAGVS